MECVMENFELKDYECPTCGAGLKDISRVDNVIMHFDYSKDIDIYPQPTRKGMCTICGSPLIVLGV